MKTEDEIKKELSSVEFALRAAYKKDIRLSVWEGYRSALMWVLGLNVSIEPDTED